MHHANEDKSRGITHTIATQVGFTGRQSCRQYQWHTCRSLGSTHMSGRARYNSGREIVTSRLWGFSTAMTEPWLQPYPTSLVFVLEVALHFQIQEPVSEPGGCSSLTTSDQICKIKIYPLLRYSKDSDSSLVLMKIEDQRSIAFTSGCCLFLWCCAGS